MSLSLCVLVFKLCCISVHLHVQKHSLIALKNRIQPNLLLMHLHLLLSLDFLQYEIKTTLTNNQDFSILVTFFIHLQMKAYPSTMILKYLFVVAVTLTFISNSLSHVILIMGCAMVIFFQELLSN